MAFERTYKRDELLLFFFTLDCFFGLSLSVLSAPTSSQHLEWLNLFTSWAFNTILVLQIASLQVAKETANRGRAAEDVSYSIAASHQRHLRLHYKKHHLISQPKIGGDAKEEQKSKLCLLLIILIWSSDDADAGCWMLMMTLLIINEWSLLLFH